jgi:hypothetical protein
MNYRHYLPILALSAGIYSCDCNNRTTIAEELDRQDASSAMITPADTPNASPQFDMIFEEDGGLEFTIEDGDIPTMDFSDQAVQRRQRKTNRMVLLNAQRYINKTTTYGTGPGQFVCVHFVYQILDELGTFKGMDSSEHTRMKRRIYGSLGFVDWRDMHIKNRDMQGIGTALKIHGKGIMVPLSQAQPGDFYQSWYNYGKNGHSGIIRRVRRTDEGLRFDVLSASTEWRKVGIAYHRDLAGSGRKTYVGRLSPDAIDQNLSE